MKTMHIGKRIFAVFFALLLCLTLLPVFALANDDDDDEKEKDDDEIEYDVSGISLSETYIELYPGSSKSIYATVLPLNATHRLIDEWRSSNDTVATVDDREESGFVTAHSPGKAEIAVGATDNSNIIGRCIVNVLPEGTPRPTYKPVTSVTPGKSYLIGIYNSKDSNKSVFLLQADNGSAHTRKMKLNEKDQSIALLDPSFTWELYPIENNQYALKQGNSFLSNTVADGESSLRMINAIDNNTTWVMDGAHLKSKVDQKGLYLDPSKDNEIILPVKDQASDIVFFEAENKPKLESVSASLGDEIGLHFYMYLPKGYENGVMDFNVISSTGKGAIRKNLDVVGTKTENGLYEYICDVSTIEMGDKIEATYKANGETYPITGTIDVPVGVTIEHRDISVMNYLHKVIYESKNENAPVYNVATALVDYGIYAQNALEAGKDHTPITRTASKYPELKVPENIPGSRVNLDLGGDQIESATISMDLESKTILNFYLDIDPMEEPTSVEIKSDGYSRKPEWTEIDEDRIKIQAKEISADLLLNEFELTVVFQDKSYKITASPMSYVRLCVEDSSMSNEWKDLCKSLYNYAVAADALRKAQTKENK